MAEIILFEDSAPLRRIVTRYLREAGHNVTAFENGAISGDPAMLEHADIVITDMSMPGVDGRQTLQNIRLLRPDLPVIVVTGMDLSADPAIHAGCGYLRKPFDEADLLAVIDAALNENESGNESYPATMTPGFADAGEAATTTSASFCGPLVPLAEPERISKPAGKHPVTRRIVRDDTGS